LDDPDCRTAQVGMDRLRSKGPAVLETLIQFTHESGDELALERARELSSEINVSVLSDAFRNLKTNLQQGHNSGLEDGAFLIARYGYPNLDQAYFQRELDRHADRLLGEIK